MGWALPFAALVIAGMSLVLSTFLATRTANRAASSEWVEQLEKRIDECEKDREALRREVSALRDRELRYLTRIVRLEEGFKNGDP